MAEGERTVPPPSPSWAEMVRRGRHPQSVNSPPPAPAEHHPSPPFAHLLNLYRRCVAEGRWARFTLETKYCEEEFSFTCSGRSAAATPSPSAPSTQKRCRKRPPNQRRREKERRRQEVQKENRRAAHVAALSAAAGLATASSAAISAAPVSVAAAVQEAAGQVAAVPTAATLAAAVPTAATQLAAVPPPAAVQVVAVPRAALQVAAGTATAVSTAAVPVAAVLRAAAVPVAAAAEAASFSAAVPAAAERATAALRQRTKTAAGERRASARTSVLAKRRDSSVIGTPETLRCPEMEVPELELSLDLGERDSVFPPSPGEVQREKEEDVMESETFWNRWKRENLPPECI